MSRESVSFIGPCAQLKPYVRYYWILKSDEVNRALTFPIGCPQLIFHRGTRFYIPELNAYQARFSVSGQVNFPAWIHSSGGVDSIVVVFHPHALGSIFNVPLSEFYNHEIDGYALGDRSMNRLATDVLTADSADDTIGMIERWLLKRLESADHLNFMRIGASMRCLLSNPRTSVEDMSGRACLSRKQFERVFFSSVGMRPKEYSEIVRFQRALWLMQRRAFNSSDIAYQCGYADQSHFIRHCRRYAGITPTQLITSGAAYSDLFTTPV